MDWKKFCSRTVALFMAFCLLFTCAAPARAAETGGTWATVSIPADVGVSSVMNGLGVLPGENPHAYDGIVERCVDYLREQGKVIDGKIEAWKREQVEGTPWAYGIDVSIIDVIRAWLFNDEKAVYVKSNAPYYTDSGYSSSLISKFNGYYTECLKHTYHFLAFASGTRRYYCGYSDSSPFIYQYLDASKDYMIVTADNSEFRYYYMSLSAVSGSRTTGIGSITQEFVSKDYEEVYTDNDLTLGVISPVDTSLAEAYPIWHGNSVAVPPIVGGGSETDDDVVVYPIAPGDTLADTQNKTQEDVWAGAGTITDAPAIPDTVTLADVLSAIVSIPGDIVEGIGKLFFPDVGAFEISLSDFFPFCIPYDIFEFFTLLRAEPEAPVFHWEIPVPQLGQTFDIDVDLSAWDEVAELFRTLELLAFIVGLAYVTREKFLRS